MAMKLMDVVKQTGKTIIFEEYNRDEGKEDLVTLLTRDSEDISLEKFKEALMGKESALMVRSFEEFVEKFAPTIYETVVKTEDGSAKFVYDLEKPKYDCNEIKLKDHAFYKMVMALVDRKASSDKGNFEFPYDDLKKVLSPEGEKEACLRIRKNLISNTKEYFRLTESGEPSVEAERFAQNIVACRDKIVEKYQNKSPLGLVPILIADKQTQIEQIKRLEDVSDEGSFGETKLIPCRYSFDDTGNLQLIEQKISDVVETSESEDEISGQLIEVVKDDFREFAPLSFRENNYLAELIVEVFVPNGGTQLVVKSREELEEEKKQLQDIYSSSLQSFSEAVAAVVEKFVGVKSFFDHATCDGKLATDVSVIISNCKIDAILNDEVAKRRFKKYFGALSYEKDVNKIWFGIIPAIAYGLDTPSKMNKQTDPFGRRTEEVRRTKKSAHGLVTLDAAKEMMALLKEVKIMTFVNYKAGERTGFVELNENQVNEFKKDFESVDSEYAVFAYPNFTILPKERNAVRIGTEYDQYERKEVNSYIVVPGIYLEASYVACGLVVGIQNHQILKKKGFSIAYEFPCVRFDIEDTENAKRITTKLNRETTTEMLKQTKDAIMNDRFGFVFADNKIIFEGKALTNSYVLNARTLRRDNKGVYKAIYKTLVRSLVDQLLRALDDNVTGQSVNRFIKEYVEEWKKDNKDAEKKYANRILLEGETIELDKEKHKLVVKFNKELEVWDDIVINDDVVNSSESEG